MRIDILTLFPEMFQGVLGSSILKRAAEPVLIKSDSTTRPPVCSYHVHNIRDHTTNRHQKVDQPPYGGGPGMVIQPQPVYDCVQAVEAEQSDTSARRIHLTPTGKPWTQKLAEEYAQLPRILLIAGHYEAIDQRAIDTLQPDEISIGDYVLSGGELAAMVLIDSIVRLIPGALGHDESAHNDSFSEGAKRLLDHPHYTRPAVWNDMPVPDVLMSGNHAHIEKWREEQSLKITQQNRPDLLNH
ncbi:tRNA (guanosine(37)-N1)-methyltransferase TrmD [Poriferisphaera sp. WC338]|uniref:tRNA (guanosine(37)-N1)-methyltransferase TrmD n=1 Tax=Poriferisphaera sp. WC338 TaxID=3425129 RepID=UPI003D819E6D